MFSSTLKIIIILSLVFQMKSNVVPVKNCQPSKMGCECLNIEFINNNDIRSCCNKKMETLFITGPLVKNISVDISSSECASNFVNLVINGTSLVRFYSQFKGLNNVSSVTIAKNQYLSDFNKLIFQDVNPDILSIHVESNSFRSISKKTFANLTKLTYLQLTDNKIGYIEDQSFEDLRVLRSLYLNGNILTLLNSDVFSGLEALTVLNLLNNPLQEPKSTDIFKHLKGLRHLQMSHSTNADLPGINMLPDRVFFPVRQLRDLNMTSLRIRNLTSLTFYGLGDLERLDLRGNYLTTINAGALHQVPRVSSINLSYNQLICLLADTFHSLLRLTNLDLSHNELTYISEDVFKDLTRLQTLDLDGNSVFVIEKNAFVGLHSLILIKLNIVNGRAKNEIEKQYKSSSLAKLRSTTKIIGLMEHFGVLKGMDQPAELPKIVHNGSNTRWKMACPVASTADLNPPHSSGSYLLIIVGICVMFLLIAFAIIMTYRAWSKQRMGEMTSFIEGEEKQEMILCKNAVVNGRMEKPNPKPNHNRKSINGGSVLEVAEPNKQRHSNNQMALSAERGHSDDESALTPLGVL